MSRMSLYIPLGVFAAILGLGYIGFDLGARNELPSALINKPFPEFQARLLESPETTLSREDLLGRPTLINVWATWCPTCLSEHEQLMQIAASTDVVIVGVNYKDQPNKAKQWLAQYGNPTVGCWMTVTVYSVLKWAFTVHPKPSYSMLRGTSFISVWAISIRASGETNLPRAFASWISP